LSTEFEQCCRMKFVTAASQGHPNDELTHNHQQ